MFLGQVLDIQESLGNEFKEFCLKRSIYDYYTREEIECIVTSGVLPSDFNNVIYDTLQRYMLYYVPKYASGFSTCDTSGTLYIGVNDFGEVTGIPVLGIIDPGVVQKYLDEVVDRFLRLAGGAGGTGGTGDAYTAKAKYTPDKRIYTDDIKVTIEKLDIEMYALSDESRAMMRQMRDDYSMYALRYKQYLTDRDAWLAKLLTYTCKLTLVLKNKNEEITEYIMFNCTDIDLMHMAIASVQINVGAVIGYELILQHKDDPTHFIYWLLRFKDNIVGEHLTTRPVQPLLPRSFNMPFALMTHLSDLRHVFLRNNDDLQYYLIKISLPCNIDQNNNTTRNRRYLEFKHPYKNAWDARTRILHASLGPCLAMYDYDDMSDSSAK